MTVQEFLNLTPEKGKPASKDFHVKTADMIEVSTLLNRQGCQVSASNIGGGEWKLTATK